MKTIAAKEARDGFSELLDTAQREPVRITKKNRPVAVLLSEVEYSRLQALEDAVWAAKAREAAKGGFLSPEESERVLSGMLDAQD